VQRSQNNKLISFRCVSVKAITTALPDATVKWPRIWLRLKERARLVRANPSGIGRLVPFLEMVSIRADEASALQVRSRISWPKRLLCYTVKEEMSEDAQLEKLAMHAAEEILRTIYGDDFKGCSTNPESIATLVREALKPFATKQQSLLHMYEKVVEGIHRLSTPPDISKISDPSALRSLLGEQLDAIHSITAQAIETTSRVKQ